MASIISVDNIRSTGGTANIIDIDSSANTTAITIDSSGNLGDITMNAEGGTNTTSVRQGVLKMWVMFNGSSAPTTADSLNVGSLTDNGSGDYTINRTNAMNNANYSTSSMCDENGVVFINTGTYSTTANEIHVKDSNSQSKNDYDRIGVHVAGDLA